jgi:hypothetical protein
MTVIISRSWKKFQKAKSQKPKAKSQSYCDRLQSGAVVQLTQKQIQPCTVTTATNRLLKQILLK